MAEITKRKSICDNLSTYDYLAKKDDYIEVSEWTNREGWDITLKDKIISLTDGELAAINHLTNLLMYNK